VGPVPLAAIGLLGYMAVVSLSFAGLRDLRWWLCLGLSLVSGGLMATLAFVLKAPCAFCAVSALTSAVLLVLAEVDLRRRQGLSDRRGIFVLAAVVMAGAFRGATISPKLRGMQGFFELTNKYKPEHPPLVTSSSAAEIALAKHLKAIGANCYTAWWCPHCQEQREQFGQQAAALAPFVQCSSPEKKTLAVCKDDRIDGYPTWIMPDGTKLSGGRELAELAQVSGFTAFPAESFRDRTDEELEYIWGPADPVPAEGDGD
jgi:hypothetical protein